MNHAAPVAFLGAAVLLFLSCPLPDEAPPEEYTVTVSLLPPDGDLLDCSCLGADAEESIDYYWTGRCPNDDSRRFYIDVRPKDGAWCCADYVLYLDMWELAPHK
jgi:hypothetical protein